MERLTIPDKRIDAHTTRRAFIDASAVREDAMKFYWRLKAYEDTGLMPEDIPTGLQLASVFCMLNELREYEALGTPEELKSLKEQAQSEQGCEYCQRDKECEFDFGYLVSKFCCSDCSMTDCVHNHKGAKYCRHCGRKLDGGGERDSL